ncbi:MAG: hypothetical protein N4A57_08085 [Anaeromicrobium sp.]|uniref:hypothetical protein n=1 Tax=Anaeromicrobium sp. TaxID=1929132 RepID=UPI0025CEB9FE|nr:hypothetical protein [Anaeromicrobium sp.]MCT4594210.1 hypothetical protein [Anaeromicrobium sp.]
MKNKNKLPPNIQHLLMEIGEKSVLFRLFLLTKEFPDCKVFQNLSGAGYDILFLNGNKEVKVEVKTRQRLYTTSNEKQKRTVQFTVTKNEYDNCDYVIAYWYEKNYYFIVPKKDLRETSSNGKALYKFVVRELANGEIDDNSYKYLDEWEQLIV